MFVHRKGFLRVDATRDRMSRDPGVVFAEKVRSVRWVFISATVRTADFAPCQHGSMCLPINWTGSSEEYFVLSASHEEGGLFDGRGRCVVKFPADGHPDLCNAVLDMTGDCRDEIVVWDPFELWVYTQHDNPKEGRLSAVVQKRGR